MGTYSQADKVADRRRNERKREALRMHAAGRSPAEIVEALDMKREKAIATVKGWIRKGSSKGATKGATAIDARGKRG